MQYTSYSGVACRVVVDLIKMKKKIFYYFMNNMYILQVITNGDVIKSFTNLISLITHKHVKK